MALKLHKEELSSARHLSLRDPEGQLVDVDGRLIRLVAPKASETLREALQLPCLKRRVEEGTFVETTLLGDAELRRYASHWRRGSAADAPMPALCVEHKRLPFLSFPSEWPPEMLYEAGRLQIDLAIELLEHGMCLKDATPYNVVFHGTRPVFIDVLSIERREAGDPIWLPFAQFVRTFVLPLLANRNFGLPIEMVFQCRRDGLEPQELYKMAGFWRRLSPALFSLVTLPTWLTRQKRRPSDSIYEKKVTNPEKARFMLGANLRYLRRALEGVRPRTATSSKWSGYMDSGVYRPEQLDQKEKFVLRALAAGRSRRVLDVGCNTGHYSALAAKQGASVVGIDSDPTVVGRSFARARSEGVDVLPLVGSLTRPTPGTGWQNQESTPFLQRAGGRFDALLLLAVIHHMVITDGIPLPEVVRLLASVTTDALIIEFVGWRDLSCRHLARGRDFSFLTEATFEEAIAPYFRIAERQNIDGTERTMYHLRRLDRTSQ